MANVLLFESIKKTIIIMWQLKFVVSLAIIIIIIIFT